MRQGVMGNASIFARELGGTSDLAEFYYLYVSVGTPTVAFSTDLHEIW